MSFGLFLPVAVLAARARSNGLEAHDHYALAVANLGAVALLLVLGRAAFNSGGSPALRKMIFAGAFVIAAANVVAPRMLRRMSNPQRNRLLLALVAAIALAALSLFIPRSAFVVGHQPEVLVLAVIFAFLLASGGEVRRGVRIVADAIVVIFLFAAAVDMFPYGGRYRFSQDFYLGPVGQILHGQAMLVDVFSQYGVGVMYFLAALFHIVPFGYGGFQVIVGIGTALELIAVYTVLRIGCRQPLYALLGTLVCLVAAIVSGVGPNVGYPSTGPLRFAIPWTLVMVAALRARRPKESFVLEGSMLAIVALASIWSVETFVYTVGTYVAVLVLDTAYVDGGSAERIRYCMRRLAILGAGLVLAQVLFAAMTRFWSGSWPDWGGYLAYLRLYSYGKFGTQLVAPWSLGYPIAALYFVTASAIVFLFVQRRAFVLVERPAITSIAASAAFGLLAYTYFLGRSHPNNLHHISPPAVALGTLWVGLLARCVPDKRARIVLFVVAGWAGAALVAQVDHPASLIAARPILTRNIHLDAARARALLDGRSPVKRAIAAAQMLDRFAPGSSRVAVVLNGQTQTAALIAAHRGNLLPISDPYQDGLLPARSLARVVSRLDRLAPGEIVLTQRSYLAGWRTVNASPVTFPPLNPDQPDPVTNRFETVVLQEILRRYRYHVVARGPAGLVVLRLGRPVPAGD